MASGPTKRTAGRTGATAGATGAPVGATTAETIAATAGVIAATTGTTVGVSAGATTGATAGKPGMVVVTIAGTVGGTAGIGGTNGGRVVGGGTGIIGIAAPRSVAIATRTAAGDTRIGIDQVAPSGPFPPPSWAGRQARERDPGRVPGTRRDHRGGYLRGYGGYRFPVIIFRGFD